jgi:tetratricopeptide (TPR) repeat protein
MRQAILSLFSAVVVTAALQAQSPPRDLNRRGEAVKGLQFWVESVSAHRPGTPDEGTRTIAGWTPGQFDDLLIDLPSLLKLMDQPRGDEFSVFFDRGRDAGRRRVVYSRDELVRLRRLARVLGGRDPNVLRTPADDARVVAAQNRLLKRGAALHTTIALNRSDSTNPRPSNPFAATRDGVIEFADGRQVGIDRGVNQWRFTRSLLDLVEPTPASDSAVRDWYRASSALLLRNLQLQINHTERALRLFPDDPVMLTLGGSVYEALASAQVQAFVKSATLPRDIVLRVGSPRAELGRAEPLLRRAVSIDARAYEARVRLGRVLSLRERHADALSELRRLDPSAPPLLQYYASLFIGDAAEALGRADDARVEYERAAQLYPLAQAPRFALSQLASATGDATHAADALERLLSKPDPSPEDDPFWTYYTSAGRDADALLVTAYRTLTTEATR